MSRAVRPRRGRMAAFWTSVVITLVSVLGGIGVLPTTQAAPGAEPQAAIGLAGASTSQPVQQIEPAVVLRALPEPESAVEPGVGEGDRDQVLAGPPGLLDERRDVDRAGLEATIGPADPLPPASGNGRRVVFDQSEQRVWLVDGSGVVRRTYLVSGSVYDNLDPGTYEVYSRSRHAVGIDDSGTMEYMVRFTRGDRAAIGFHSIPVDDGEKVQTRGELGTPLSHGCVRQWKPDARALWDFAPVGTTVVVTA